MSLRLFGMIAWFAWAGCVLGYTALMAGAMTLDDRVSAKAVAEALAHYEAAKPDPADAVADDDLRLGIAGVAVLVQGDGGADRAFWTVIIDMVARGVLEPGTTYDGKPTIQLSAAHRAPAPDASDTERKIWSLAACRNPASAAPHNVTHPIAQSLLTEGYLRGNGASIDFRAPRPVWCWTVAAPTLPFAALMMFLLLHWRYAIVAMWTATAMAVVAWGLTMPTEKPAALRLPVLTERGDQRTEPYAPGEAAAYAVFGLEAYNHFASHTPGFSTAVDKGTADRERNEAAEELRRNWPTFNG
ncbi:hypothetical protein ACQ86D_15760 [Streptomyces galilaeus]